MLLPNFYSIEPCYTKIEGSSKEEIIAKRNRIIEQLREWGAEIDREFLDNDTYLMIGDSKIVFGMSSDTLIPYDKVSNETFVNRFYEIWKAI